MTTWITTDARGTGGNGGSKGGVRVAFDALVQLFRQRLLRFCVDVPEDRVAVCLVSHDNAPFPAPIAAFSDHSVPGWPPFSHTLHVQTTAGQHLITSGLYHTVRHPAYSGSILSLLGAALAFRNIAAVCLVLFFCLICYSTRIRVEEKALEAQFGEEYIAYKRGTYRLLPYIF